MKKLFNVTIENEFCVMAEDIEEAEQIARESLGNEGYDNFTILAEIVTPSSPYINFYEQDSIPYGSDDNKTCKEIIKEMIEAEELRKIKTEADKKQLKFGFYDNTKN